MQRFLIFLSLLLSASLSVAQTGPVGTAIINTQKGPTVLPPINPILTLSGVSTVPSTPFTVTVRITAAYPVGGFDASDFITNTDGSVTVGSLTKVNDSTYTIPFTPPSAGHFLSIRVDANSVFSPVFVGNLPSNQLDFNYAAPSPTEYRTNLLEEFIANGGGRMGALNFVPSTGGVQKQYDWGGVQNNYRITGVGLVDIPVAGILTMDGTADYFTYPTNTYPGISGPITLAYLVKSSATVSKTSTLFDTNTNTPRLKCFLRISAANSHMGISYNGTTFDSGFDFTYDGNLHVLIFRIDGTNSTASIWVDGVQKGSTFTITGGGLNANTGQFLYCFNGVGAPSGQFAPIKIAKFRIYTEAINNTNIGIISTGDFINTTPSSVPVHVVIFSGQSNTAPPVADNYRSFYPAYLQTGLTSIYIWQQTANSYKFVPMADNVDVFATSGAYRVATGANLEIAYRLRAKYPDDEIRIIEFYQAATALAVAWENTVPNSLQSILTSYIDNGLSLLKAEQRNIVDINFLWWQGEGDAVVAPINYSTSISTTVTNGSPTVTFSGVGPKPPLLAGMAMTIRSVNYTINTVNTVNTVTLSTNYAGSSETITANTTNCNLNTYAFDYRANLDTLDTNVRTHIATFYSDSVKSVFIKLSSLAATSGKEPNWLLVQNAQLSKVASNTALYKLINSDSDHGDGSLIMSSQFWGGNVHYKNPSLTEAGRRFVLDYYAISLPVQNNDQPPPSIEIYQEIYFMIALLAMMAIIKAYRKNFSASNLKPFQL